MPALNTYRTLHIKTHNARQENKFSNVTILTSQICHSRTLQDVDFLLLSGILASFLLQISFSVTAVIPRPDFSSVNRPAKPFSAHRLKLSIAGSFSLSANNGSPEFSNGYIAATPQTPLWIIIVSDSQPLTLLFRACIANNQFEIQN